MAASYSDAPLSTIDVGALTASRFLLREQRLFPYRDGEGRVALSLVRDSLARLSETDSAVLAGSGTTFAEVSAKLSRWLRHAERWASAQAHSTLEASGGHRSTSSPAASAAAASTPAKGSATYTALPCSEPPPTHPR